MQSVALTGNVASGKSTVAGFWKAAGVPVVSADELAREVVRPGSEGLRSVVEAFGPSVLDRDGTLDRAALRDLVFRDERQRRRLEELLHPRIEALRERWIAERRLEGAPLVVSEIPLLFETGLESRFDATVFVDAPAEESVRRMMEGRGIERTEAERILDAQMPADEKRTRADHVLVNDASLEDLEARAGELLERLSVG